MINAALKTSYSIHYYEIFVKWEWNLPWYISDMTFKISFYSQACPKSWKGMTNKLLLCTGPFSGLLHISHSVWDFVFSSHRHTWAYTVQTPATICILHLPYLPPNQHNPTFLHFRQNNLPPPPQKNGPKCRLPASAPVPLTTPVKSVSALGWNMSSTGEMFTHLNLLCSFKSLQSTERCFRNLELCQVWVVFS